MAWEDSEYKGVKLRVDTEKDIAYLEGQQPSINYGFSFAGTILDIGTAKRLIDNGVYTDQNRKNSLKRNIEKLDSDIKELEEEKEKLIKRKEALKKAL